MVKVYGDIRFRRGLESDGIPDFPEGQPALTQDSKRVFVGTESGNLELANQEGVNAINDELSTARGGLSRLVDRLDEIDTQIAERVKKTDLDINVKDYGAVGNGGTDDTDSFKAAIVVAETLNRNIYVPSGDYILSDTLTCYKSSVFGDGMGKTRLIFVNMDETKNGLYFNNIIVHNQIGAVGMSILVKGQNGGKAITTPYNSGQNTVYKTKYVFRDLWFSGYTYPTTDTNNAYETIEAWACGLEVGDAFDADIDHVKGVGNWRVDKDPSTQFQCVLIRLSAAFTLMTSQISKITFANIYRGIELGNRVFFQISQVDIAHAHDGIYETGTVTFDESRIFHGNINAQNKNVYLKGRNNREVHGITVRRHRSGWKGLTNDWYGFHFDGGAGNWLTNCHSQPDETNGVWGGQSHTLVISNPCTTSGNVIVTLDGVATTIALSSTTENTAILVAKKIRATALANAADWGVGGSGNEVVFTAKTTGTKSGTFSYDAGTTGAAGLLSLTFSSFTQTNIGACITGGGDHVISNFIVGATCHEGIRYDDCTGVLTNNTKSWQGSVRGTSAKLFAFYKNARSSKWGIYATASTFTGTVFYKDANYTGSNNVQVSTVTV